MSNQRLGTNTAVASSGTITAVSQNVALTVDGGGGFGVLITGIAWTGTIEIEGTVDGTTWSAIRANPIGASAGPVTSTTANGTWSGICGGLQQIRVRSSAWSSGTANIELRATPTGGEAAILIRDAAGNNRGANVDSANRLQTATTILASVGIDVSSSLVFVEGDVANDAADGGNPVKIGGRADSGSPSIVQSGDRVNAWLDLFGAQVTRLKGYAVPDALDPIKRFDDAWTTPHSGISILGVRRDSVSTANGPGSLGDYGTLSLDNSGRLFVSLQAPSVVAQGPDPVKRSGDAGGDLDAGLNIVGRRQDADTPPTGVIEGDTSQLLMGSSGGVKVEVIAGGAGGGQVEGDVAHDAADSGNPVKIGGTATVALPTGVGEGDRVQASFDLTGRLRVNQPAGSGQVEGDVADNAPDSGNPVKIGGRVQQTAPVYAEDDRCDARFDDRARLMIEILNKDGGNAAGSAIQTADTANVAGNGAIHIVGVRRDEETSPVAANTRFHQFLFDNIGQLKTRPGGGVAHDAADAGNPIKIGGKATSFTSFPTAVNDGDRVDAHFDSFGRLGVRQDTSYAEGSLGALNAIVGIDSPAGAVTFQIASAGTLAGTIVAEVQNINSNWVIVPIMLNDGSIVTSIVVAGDEQMGSFVVNGAQEHRIRVSAYTSGTSQCRILASPGSPGVARNLVQGSVAHNAVDSGHPVKIGGRGQSGTLDAVADNDRVDAAFDLSGRQHVIAEGEATHGSAGDDRPVVTGGIGITHGAQPAVQAVSTNVHAMMNRQGLQFVISSHPGTVHKEITVTDADGSQTGTQIVAVGAAERAMVTQVTIVASPDNSVPIDVRVALSTSSTLPAASTTGVEGVPLSVHQLRPGDKISKGDGSGIIGQGIANEDLRYSCDDPVGGDVRIFVSYFIVADA